MQKIIIESTMRYINTSNVTINVFLNGIKVGEMTANTSAYFEVSNGKYKIQCQVVGQQQRTREIYIEEKKKDVVIRYIYGENNSAFYVTDERLRTNAQQMKLIDSYENSKSGLISSKRGISESYNKMVENTVKKRKWPWVLAIISIVFLCAIFTLKDDNEVQSNVISEDCKDEIITIINKTPYNSSIPSKSWGAIIGKAFLNDEYTIEYDKIRDGMYKVTFEGLFMNNPKAESDYRSAIIAGQNKSDFIKYYKMGGIVEECKLVLIVNIDKNTCYKEWIGALGPDEKTIEAYAYGAFGR